MRILIYWITYRTLGLILLFFCIIKAKFPEEDIADESSIKGEESDSKNDDAPSEPKIHDNLLQLRTETPWKKVEKRQKGTRTYGKEFNTS